MISCDPGFVRVYLNEGYDNCKTVSETEWNSVRDFEILESSLSHLDAECVRFLKLAIGKFYVLNRNDDYIVSVEDICKAMRVSPEESVRIMFWSYVQLAKVMVAERRKSKGRKYFYVQERLKPLLAEMRVYDRENPKLIYVKYEEVVDLPVQVIRRLVMELPMPASVLCNYDRFMREMLSLLPSVIERCRVQAEQAKPDADMMRVGIYRKYATDKQPVVVA